MALPERASIVAQVLEILRGEIASGRWRDRLPGERFLADHFQVCRSTLRAALGELRKAGALEVHHKRYWIRKAPGGARVRATDSTVIGWLTTDPPESLPHYKLLHIDEVRRHLHSAGYALEVHCEPRLNQRHPRRILENLTALTRAACWVLTMAPVKVQEWFARVRLPAVVAGSRFRDLPLPALDFNYRAVSRHAAGLFLSHGHRRVAFLLPSKLHMLGDAISLEALREGMAGSTTLPKAEVIAGEHDGSVRGICSALDMIFHAKSPPTALFVSHPMHVLTVISHLGRLRRRVPEDVSVLARQYDTFHDYLDPRIDGYEFSMRQYTTRLVHMIVQLAKGGSLWNRQFLTMGRYRKGNSLGNRPPAA